jgi:O-antigen ligase
MGIALARHLAAGRRRSLALCSAAGVLLAVAAIAATGSRGGALGLAAGLTSLALFAGVRQARWLLAAALAAAVVLPLVSTARPLSDTVAGRLYIWRVALPHALDRPMTGWGPGAFELVYHDWQGSREPTPEAAGFAGPQQRAHNDYLEALVERGVPGVVATCLLFVAAAMVFRNSRRGEGHAPAAGAAASVMAAAAIAVVDFPLARPAEMAAVWCAAAVLAIGARTAGAHTARAGDTTRLTQEEKDAP